MHRSWSRRVNLIRRSWHRRVMIMSLSRFNVPNYHPKRETKSRHTDSGLNYFVHAHTHVAKKKGSRKRRSNLCDQKFSINFYNFSIKKRL